MSRVRLLLCDDVEPLLDAMQRALEKRVPEADCTLVRTGRDALERARHEKFDAVITDYHLGGLNGIELCLRLRREHPNLALMLMSAYSDLPLSVGGFGAVGIDCILQKPFNILRLAQAARYLTHTDAATRARIRGKYAFFIPSDSAGEAGDSDARHRPNICTSGHPNAQDALFCNRCGLRLEPRTYTLQYEPYVGNLEEARRFALTLNDPELQRSYQAGIDKMVAEAHHRILQTS